MTGDEVNPLTSAVPFLGQVHFVFEVTISKSLKTKRLKVVPSSSSCSPAVSLGFTILGEIFAYVTVFVCLIQPVLSSWMAHAGCVFVGGIHPCRT